MQRSEGPDDELDDVLDDALEGRTDQYAEDLEPMVATARLLKDALSAHELPPEVAARHIQRALTPAKHRPTRRRSRARVAVTVLLAATLIVSMTAVASANPSLSTRPKAVQNVAYFSG